MAKLTRKLLKVFGTSGGASYFEQFGSYVAAAQSYTKDIELIQGLAAWVNGWQNAVVTSNKAPLMEDMNAVMLVHSYQTAYLLQEGVPEWSATTTYYIGSVVKKTGTTEMYGSLTNDNLNQPPPVQTDDANWKWINAPSAINLVGNSLKSNLQVQANSGTPLSKVDINADLLSVQGVVLNGVDLTANIVSSGVDGLDTGSPSASTWYAIHVITNAAGTLVASLLSLSPTAPTLPSGYTLFRRVGWVYNNASGNLVSTYRSGDVVLYADPHSTEISIPDGDTLNVSFAVTVPPGLRNFELLAQAYGSTAGRITARMGGSSYEYVVICAGRNTTENGIAIAQVRLLLSAARTLDFSISATLSRSLFTMAYDDPV